MSPFRLVLRSASYYWRTNLAVVFGVAVSVAVLAGALLVGDSVRGSLRDIAIGRLGRTDHVVSSTGFFRVAMAEALPASVAGTSAAPMIVASGFLTHEASGRRAASVLVYGVDDRFWRFHGIPAPSGVQVSPALARELGVTAGDVLLARLQKPSAIPIESLFGRKDEVGRTVRLDVGGVLPAAQLGEFALRPQQSEVRAVFAPLNRIQRDLAVPALANTLLVAGGDEAAIGAGVRRALSAEDLGVKVSTAADPAAVVIDGAIGILGAPLEAAARQVADKRNLEVLPVFTYLANALRAGDREIPYSLVTATDRFWTGRSSSTSALPIGCVAGAIHRSAMAARTSEAKPLSTDWIVLNQWASDELKTSPGDRVELDYYRWDAAQGLTTHTATFVVDSCVAPDEGLTADRRLAPEYPGITEANSLADWDPPFPVDLARVRPQDEKYWKDYRTTPKAFIAFSQGRDLWTTRYGGATSIRLRTPDGMDSDALAQLVREDLRALLDPAAMGVSVQPVRRLALDASAGTTDFGQYFIYFSFFLVVSALMLTVLFFRLGIEQRLRQIGVLRAAGFAVALIRRLLLTEAVVLAAAGSLLGLVGAVAYGWVIVYGLRTWWVGAVGTTLLDLHVSWLSLAAGAGGGLIASALCVMVSLRAIARLSPRALLSAQAIDAGGLASDSARPRRAIAAVLFGAAGGGMLAAGLFVRGAQTAMFFGAGASLLVAGLCLFSWWVRSPGGRPLAGRGTWPVVRLGFRSATFRPSRSVLSAALIASAAFLIVSIDAFRRGGGEVTTDPHSGTGGFALIAQSEVPLLHSPNDAAGREALVVSDQAFSQVSLTRFRLRAGDDASCLNLYRPSNPTIIAPEAGFLERGRFTFAASEAESEAERANPWLLLHRPAADGVVPVVADATSMQYALHVGLGDTMTIETGGDHPLVLRFVGALSDSVLQGQLVMAEEQFVRLFPSVQGYRFFLADIRGATNASDVNRVAGDLERELGPFGFDAVSAAERLAAFHRVENTYLSTFQALGGLGLVLGTIGLAAILLRNALERRRELALLRAVGYAGRRVSLMIMAEAALLLAAGLGIGAGCAALAVAPAWLARGGSGPGAGLLVLLAAVAASGLVSSYIAARAALRGNLLEALRAE